MFWDLDRPPEEEAAEDGTREIAIGPVRIEAPPSPDLQPLVDLVDQKDPEEIPDHALEALRLPIVLGREDVEGPPGVPGVRQLDPRPDDGHGLHGPGDVVPGQPVGSPDGPGELVQTHPAIVVGSELLRAPGAEATGDGVPHVAIIPQGSRGGHEDARKESA